jgi:acyl carrier protein
VGCCAYEVQAEDSRSGPVPIGGPIANAQLYVLDDSLRPVSPGVIGELHIGGAGVARGYLGKPELTRERFLADPFSTTAGARLYKTGDLVRHRKDGNLEFLGRADDQVKVRGYRIELGEIEATLAAHPGVRSCTVLAREGLTGNKQLVAFVISRESESVDAPSLKKFLKQKLPDYMVPGHIIFLSSFPLNHNGKIDRKSLLNLPFNDAPAGQKFVAPRTKTEKILTGVWREMLEEKHIGVYDNFFELGGDSLLAMKVLLWIRERFGIELTLRTFFPVQLLLIWPTQLKLMHDQVTAGLTQQLSSKMETSLSSFGSVPMLERNLFPTTSHQTMKSSSSALKLFLLTNQRPHTGWKKSLGNSCWQSVRNKSWALTGSVDFAWAE